MKAALCTLAAAGVLAAGSAYAQSGTDLSKSKACLNCHDVDKKKIGPSYKDVATKYKGNAHAVDQLADKVKEGKGHPKVAASEADLKAAVRHVLEAK